MKTFESQMISALLHGGALIFVLYFFVPPKAIDRGQGMLVELVQGQTPKGQKVKAPKVRKANKEVMSKPVVIATKPKKKQVRKAPKPVVVAKKAPVKPKPKVAQVTQKEASFLKRPKEQASAKAPIQPKQKSNLAVLKKAPEPPKKVDSAVSRSTGKKPAPPAAAPVVGDKKYSLSEALGKEDGVKDARQLTQKPGNIPPVYPMSDRLENEEGTVVMLAYVNGTGEVEEIKIESSTGSYLMEAESIRAFSKYRFSQNQPGWVRMPFEFQLEGPAKELHAKYDEDSLDADEAAMIEQEIQGL